MRSPSQRVWKAAEAHALEAYPAEACGLIVSKKGGLEYVPCRNVAASPNEHFRLPASDYAAANKLGSIVGVVHSHPDLGVRPSEGDLSACEASGHAWHIIAVHKQVEGPPVVAGRHSWSPDGYRAPLEGRSFHYGVLDCWQLARDWYAREMQFLMPDIERGPDKWWDVDDDFSPYEDEANYKAAGFVRLDEAPSEKGDLIIMQVRSKARKPNHLGILIDPEGGIMLHHLHGSMSETVPYGGYWREVTRFILRRKADG